MVSLMNGGGFLYRVDVSLLRLASCYKYKTIGATVPLLCVIKLRTTFKLAPAFTMYTLMDYNCLWEKDNKKIGENPSVIPGIQ